MSKHTPTPWVIQDKERTVVGDIATLYGCTGGYKTISGQRDYGSPRQIEDIEREQDANANLLVAAPDLLAACKAGLAWMKSVSSHEPERFLNVELDEMEKAGGLLEAAIAKAEPTPDPDPRLTRQLEQSVAALPKGGAA